MRTLIVVAALAAALSAAQPAAATIVPQRSIAGISLGMTEQDVIDRLGEPSSTIRETNDFGPYTELVYRARRLRVRLQGTEQVTAVSTTSRSERTSTGVGVGSSERGVRRGVSRVRCETIVGYRTCHVGAFLPGRRVTDFTIRRGSVTRVTLAIVID